MLLQKGASVQVDVVMPPVESLGRERVKKSCWQWRSITQTPVQPKRTPLLQVCLIRSLYHIHDEVTFCIL